MDSAPDRINIPLINFNTEPKDWFQNIPEKEGNKKYIISKIHVLTTRGSGRYEKFIKNNSYKDIEFIPHWGIQKSERTQDAIFDNYLDIINSKFDDEILVIIEDDVVLIPGWMENLEKCLYQLPEDWGILSGNFSSIDKIIQTANNLIKTIGVRSSMNFTIFHRRSIVKIKQKLYLRKESPYDHIDRYCFSDEVNLNSYGCWPMICREIPGFSLNRKIMTNGFDALMEYEPYKYWFIDKPKWTL